MSWYAVGHDDERYERSELGVFVDEDGVVGGWGEGATGKEREGDIRDDIKSPPVCGESASFAQHKQRLRSPGRN